MHSVRFLHASDFHLDEPLGGLTHVPSKLREDFVEAPFIAAEKAFGTAIQEKVDFVVLAGDIISLETAGPRAFDFLLNQFEQIQQHEIPVYWIGGKIDDPDLWPADLPIPNNVHVFATGRVEQIEFKKRDRHLATIVGASRYSGGKIRVADFVTTESNVARVAVAYGDFDARDFQRPSVDYWALGGMHNPRDLSTSNPVARYCGNPQGLTPAEDGIHGCSLIQIEHGRVHVQTIESNFIRWKTESLQMSADADQNDVLKMTRDRIKVIGEGENGPMCLIRWLVSCKNGLARDLRDEKKNDKLLSSLPSTDEAVSVSMELVEEDISFDQYGEDSVLGDFLRAVSEYENDPDRMLDLVSSLPESFEHHDLVSQIRYLKHDDRQQILRRVAALGIELLGGDSTATSG